MPLFGDAWALAALLAIVVRMDHQLKLSTFISQPLVSGLLAGSLFLNWQAGLLAGLVVQVAWMPQCLEYKTPLRYNRRSPWYRRLGLLDPPDASAGGAAAALVYAALLQQDAIQPVALGYSLLLGWLVGVGGSLINRLHLAINDRTVSLADFYATRGLTAEMGRIVYLDLFHNLLAALVVIWIPARLAVAAWSRLHVEALPIAAGGRFAADALLGFGVIAFVKYFATGRKGFAFGIPVIAATAYLLINSLLMEV